MTDTHTDTLAGLEAALRDAATRAMKTEMPLLLVLGFFQSVSGLAQCLRQYRALAGLPLGLSPELVTVLEAVCASAFRRVNDPGLTDAHALRLVRAIERLFRSVILAKTVPEKARNAVVKPMASRSAPPKTPIPTPPVITRRRPNDYDNIGVIAVRALDATVGRNPVFEAAFRAFLTEKNGLLKSPILNAATGTVNDPSPPGVSSSRS